VAQPPAPPQSQSVSSSFRGATLGIEGSPATSDRLSQRADKESRRLAGVYAPAYEAQGQATQGLAESQALQSEMQAQGLERESMLLRDQQEGRAREVADIQARSQQWTSKLQEAMDSIPTMDANKIFHDASTAQSAALAVSAFMGGFLQPVLGTNQPMDIINKAIDRSIMQQQNAQEQAQRKVWNTKDLAARDDDDALWELNQNDIGRLGHITALQREVAAKVQGYQSDVFRKQGEKLLADLEKSKADTYLNIFTNTRGHMESQRHNMRMESIQSQEMAMRIAEAEAKRSAAAKDAANLHLTKPTGLRTTTGAGTTDGWTATNEKEREEVGKKSTETNTRWVGIERLGRLVDKWDRLNLPNDEVRNRLVAMSAGMTIADLKPGMGSEKDAEKLTARYGGDFNTFMRMAPPEVIKKILTDTKDATLRDMADYTAKLSRDEGTRVTWEPPNVPEEEIPTGPSAGDGMLRAKAGAQQNRPDELIGGLTDIAAELKTYPDLARTPEGKAQIEGWLGELNGLPDNQRTIRLDGQYVDIKDVLTRALVEGDKAKPGPGSAAPIYSIPDARGTR
jgi:hypothetical protein